MNYRSMYPQQHFLPPSADRGFAPRPPYAHEAHQQFNRIDVDQYQSQLPPTQWTVNPENKDQNNFQYKFTPNNEISSAMFQNRPFTNGKYLYPLSEINLIENDNEYKPELKPEVKPELKSEVKSEVKFELQPMCKSELKSEIKSELESVFKNENKDNIKCMTGMATENGGGKRLKLMKYEEFDDDKSSVRSLSLPESKNIDLTLDSTELESKHHVTEHIVVKSSEDFSILVNLLKEQITTSKYTNKLLEELLLKNNSTPTSVENVRKNEQQTIRENFRSTFPYLPANSVKDMLDMDREISKDESRQLMVKRLRQCGGKSVCETTAILLRTIMTDECATYYNYEGKNNKKLSFKDLNIHEILIDVTIFVHNDETEQTITKKIKNWLRLANTRIGNKSGGQYRRNGAQTSWPEGSSFPCDPPFQPEHQEPPPPFQPEPQTSFQLDHHTYPPNHPFQHEHTIFN